MLCIDKNKDIFCITDEFHTNFDKTIHPFLLGKPSKRLPTMSKSEVITIYTASYFKLVQFLLD
jgi:hypothetical protein